ncbi:hypothetical protein ACLQ18_01130 [Streptomyces sp. DT193]|uniref:hypothetical protein n=1 Tax=Streptomyces sp. DT193 TaxID=3393418 RepID=UPI003CF30F80
MAVALPCRPSAYACRSDGGDFSELACRTLSDIQKAAPNCAISDIESNLNVGRAIMMTNGDEDYDEEHMERYL